MTWWSMQEPEEKREHVNCVIGLIAWAFAFIGMGCTIHWLWCVAKRVWEVGI